MNLDINKVFANQQTDNDGTECVALTIADIVGNVEGQLFDPDWSYAAYFALTGQAPNTAGLDIYGAMLAAVAYGVLPTTYETFSSKVMGELYIANPDNYSTQQKQHASYYVQKGLAPCPDWNSIVNHMAVHKQGVALAVRWYTSFSSPNPDGTLNVPAKGEPFTYHCVPVYELTPKGLRFKPYLGAQYGDGGYGYMSPLIFVTCFTGAYGFDPTANRNISMLWVRLYQLQYLFSILKAAYAQQHTPTATQ